jgi:hypothetical protein
VIFKLWFCPALWWWDIKHTLLYIYF